jgi:hypothetical protein
LLPLVDVKDEDRCVWHADREEVAGRVPLEGGDALVIFKLVDWVRVACAWLPGV